MIQGKRRREEDNLFYENISKWPKKELIQSCPLLEKIRKGEIFFPH